MKKRFKITTLIALPVLLFYMTMQIQPRQIHLGQINDAVMARKRAFEALKTLATHHPWARVLTVSWSDPKWSPRRQSVVYQQHKGIVDFSYYVFRPDIDGRGYVVDLTCTQVTKAKLKQLTPKVNPELQLKKSCSCNGITLNAIAK